MNGYYETWAWNGAEIAAIQAQKNEAISSKDKQWSCETSDARTQNCRGASPQI